MKILIAVSGGVDSVVLLDLFTKNRLSKFLDHNLQPITYNLTIAHFNHKIHNKADSHAKFVEKLAEKYSLPFFLGETKSKLKSEASAREARYKFLNKTAKKIGAKKIALAHHANDQIETILFNLIRGSGLNGLGGMQEFRDMLWRPLLTISKSKIESYAKKHKLKYITDPTNQDPKFSRNFLRHKVIPLLADLNPRLNEAILRTAKQAREANDFINLFAEEWLKRNESKSTLILKEFNNLPFALARSVIRKIHKNNIGNLLKIDEKHISEILELANSGRGNKEKKFGKLIFKTTRKNGTRVITWKRLKSI